VIPRAQTLPAPPRDRTNAVDRWAVARIRQTVRAAPLVFRLWDGFELVPASRPVIGRITFRCRRALLAWLWNPELHLGEAFMSGEIEIDGDLLAIVEAIYRALPPAAPRRWTRHLPNSARAARANVHHHYDLGNDFYRLWLDREMVYTCAYFPAAGMTLEDAQMAKMDLVCRKLRLQPGDRVIEAGCGWGALSLYMASRYGARVRAFNISPEQIAWARSRARADGLADRVEFVEDDYRNVSGTCDAFVSIGMLEHVGRPHYRTLGAVLDRTLAADGRGLLHFIGRNRPAPLNAWIRRRIFPGAYAPALHEVCERVLAPHEFSVLDVDNLRLHYAETLDHWLRRFDAARAAVRAAFDEPFTRAWALYLAGSEAAFTTGSLQVFQIVFARGGSNAVARTRVTG
jgi:cyclopropane-fatty-acyl-phospholipid synthase